MNAWSVVRPGAIRSRPLELQRREIPTPARGEVLVRVSACGVCRTDLHVAEGDLPVHRPGVVPGHEVVGEVTALGPATARFTIGDRVGIAWLRSTCGTCRFCTRGEENLCVSPRFTGWDDDGGYAEWAVVDERYAYRIPEVFGDAEAAPLLCAGIIGYRALQRAACPPGGRLGIWGFGGSAHIAAQVAHHQQATIHVRTRDAKARELAAELGAATVGDSFDPLPEPLDAAILFAPAGELVPVALAALGRGGTLAVAGIHLTDIPSLRYQEHLFYERQLRSVTANTRQDGEEFLALAAEIPIHVQFTTYPLAEADRALLDLAEDRVVGAAVLQPLSALGRVR